MTIVLDTSGLIAALDRSEARHLAAARVLREAAGPRSLSPFVLAEVDYLLSTRVSPIAARAMLGEVARGAYQLEPFDRDATAAALAVIDRYPDLHIGLADASVVVLADRHQADDILTLDERHFRALRGARGRPFRLLPVDVARG